MILRPVDENGNILPVLIPSAVLSGTEAVAALTRARLEMFAGEWWENPDWGNGIVDLLRDSRLTGADRETISAYLTSYIRETSGVRDVRDPVCRIDGRRVLYSCILDTRDGEAEIRYSF